MRQFFNDTVPLNLTTLESNKLKGKAAERYISSKLITALNARALFTSRTEDDAKIDLVILFSHPWLQNSVEIIPTQVKSGPSYCSIKNTRLLLEKSKFTGFLNKNHWTLVCWTNVENEPGYWFLIKPNSKFIKLEYNSNHIINPLTKFQLIRVLYSFSTQNGGKGLIFKRNNSRQEYDYAGYKELRLRAKKKYSILNKTELTNPLFGKIKFTRLGWRHITRKSRLSDFKIASFEALQIIDDLLAVSPTKHYTLRHLTKDDNDSVYVENEFLLNYNNSKVFDSETNEQHKIEVFIKLLEISCYRKDWKESANKNNDVLRRVIFKSIYYKQSSQNMHA